MDVKDIRSLIKMITETDISEFEMESAKEKIRIKRGNQPEVIHYQTQAPQPVASIPPAAPQQQLPAAQQPLEAPPVETGKGKAITSPIVGTFYRSPSPDSPPYVEAGQIVEKGQVLCIVEAMKLMNEIEADFRCKILKISMENAQPVEFGEVLFMVEPL